MSVLWYFPLAVLLASCGPGSSAPSPSGAGGRGGLNAGGIGGAASGTGGSSAGSGGAVEGGGGTGGTRVAGAGGSGGGGTVGVGGDGGGAGITGTAGQGGTGGGAGSISASALWNSPDNGNPIIPGYFANPSIFYDPPTSTFYIFAQTDGAWITFAAEPTVWYSTDFVHWKSQPLSLPSIWPTQQLRAPSIAKHPTNGHYYLAYTVGTGTPGTYVAMSTSPLGPWSNATAGTTSATASLYKANDMWGTNDWIDAQFFVDTDNTVYLTFGGSHRAGIAKLAFASTFLASIDNSDPRMTDGTIHKFKEVTSGLTNYLEGSCMFKNGTRYFMTYSNSACQNYNVQYAVGQSPVGPFTHVNGEIVQRNDVLHTLGPGHNSILQYGGSWYIVYHQQPYQYVDVKRQTAINQITFDGDTISSNVETPAGVWAGTGALETLVANARKSAEPNLAFGKVVLASSESDYKGGTSVAVPETFVAAKTFYAARYAVDQNNETRWAPATLPGSLIVDLGADRAVGRCETTFEYVLRAYRYRIEYLAATEAPTITAAQSSGAWHMYADRSSNTARFSPVVDSGQISTRYLRLTVVSADIPASQAEIRTIIETDYADRVSVVEFKVFENTLP